MWCDTCEAFLPFTRVDAKCIVCGEDLRLSASDLLDKGPCQIVKETRAAQVEMADKVEGAVRNGRNLVAEAGTGIGKSFAVLIPAILSGQRVIISTATTLLQHQYTNYALDFLEQRLAPYGIEVTYAIYKGKRHYLCPSRFKGNFKGIRPKKGFPTKKEQKVYEAIDNWAATTLYGDVSELDTVLRNMKETTPDYFSKINADGCPGARSCGLAKNCGLVRVRAEAKEAQIVVTNHMVVGLDIKLGGKILPPHSIYVMDEAHKAEGYFRNALGDSIAQRTISKLIDSVPVRALAISDVNGSLDDIKNLSASLFDSIAQMAEHTAEKFQAPLANCDELREDLQGMVKALSRLQKPLTEIAKLERDSDNDTEFVDDLAIDAEEKALYLAAKTRAENVGDRKMAPAKQKSKKGIGEIAGDVAADPAELRKAIGKVESLYSAAQRVLNDAPGWALYTESTKGKGGKTWYKLINAPVHLGDILRASLYPRLKSCVQTSATMTVGNDFSYYTDAMGLDDPQQFVASSPFDYKGRTLLYLPRHIPIHPNNQKGLAYNDKPAALDRYFSALADEIVRLLRASKGGAFVLFSARTEMNELYDRVRKRVPYPCDIQAPGVSTAALEDWFRNTGGAVLFATKSFWEGVSVEGAQLRMVIIPKVPFPSPTDPIITTKKQMMARNNDGRWFDRLYIPHMVMDVLQGFGRLMRTQEDFGIAALLDTRCIPNAPGAKSYGKKLVRSLPFTNATHDIERVRQALTDMENAMGPFDVSAEERLYSDL